MLLVLYDGIDSEKVKLRHRTRNCKAVLFTQKTLRYRRKRKVQTKYKYLQVQQKSELKKYRLVEKQRSQISHKILLIKMTEEHLEKEQLQTQVDRTEKISPGTQ